MKKPTRKEKLLYWFDSKMSGGSLGLIKMLTIVTAITAAALAVVLHIVGAFTGEGDAFNIELWDSFVTVVNSWLPYYEDGWIGYRVFMTIGGVFGLLVTSILIGIIATAIEEKMDSLKKGNVAVLEENHIVVLGFKAGEYSLIQELVYGAEKRPCCIVVASEANREEMEDAIRDNVKCPKNVRILCRSINIFDPRTLERCSLSTCRTVLISPTDNERTIRLLLAVTKILQDAPEREIRAIAVLSQNDYQIPPPVIEEYGVLLLHTEGTIARIIAHSCTQPGLSQTMMEMFHFEGSEMHIISLPGTEGLTFEELLFRVDDAFPIGICKGKEIFLNPEPGMKLEAGDRLLVFCEESDSAKFTDAQELPPMEPIPPYQGAKNAGRLVIVGCNEFLSTILSELPENVASVTLADVEKPFRDEVLKAAAQRETPLSVTFFEKNAAELSALEELARMAEHIVILSDHNRPDDEADLRSIFTIMTLRHIRKRFRLAFNITAEMRRENNQNLLIPDSDTEFVVSSNMSALFLAQLSESPELIKAFNELLTNEGNEVYLKTAEELHCVGKRSVLELRRRLLPQRYVMIGYMTAEDFHCFFELSLGDTVTLKPEDKLIVIGEN
ncbi:MAG: hypothetical protein IJQ81_08920 [Oscillibacter sp.]|nr:hypothetical protein [Oscillibacter sp.]